MQTTHRLDKCNLENKFNFFYKYTLDLTPETLTLLRPPTLSVHLFSFALVLHPLPHLIQSYCVPVCK